MYRSSLLPNEVITLPVFRQYIERTDAISASLAQTHSTPELTGTWGHAQESNSSRCQGAAGRMRRAKTPKRQPASHQPRASKRRDEDRWCLWMGSLPTARHKDSAARSTRRGGIRATTASRCTAHPIQTRLKHSTDASAKRSERKHAFEARSRAFEAASTSPCGASSRDHAS